MMSRTLAHKVRITTVNYTKAKLIGTKAEVRQSATDQELYDAMDVIVSDERFTEGQVTKYNNAIEDELCRRGF